MRKVLIICLVLGGFTLQAQDNSQTISPIPPINKNEGAKIELGHALYNDTLFSLNYLHSCNSCHNIQEMGVDRLSRYHTFNNTPGAWNTPTTLNAQYNSRQFWNGRAKTLLEVIDDHLKDPTIFNNNWNEVLKRVQSTSALKKPFNQVYKGKITENNIKDALLAYLYYLTTPNSSFDQYLNGNEKALSPKALKGYQLFKSYGCITCHQGINLGGNLYQRLGIYKPYYKESRQLQASDLGLYQITKNEEDKFVFKVPSLRNVVDTGPYLHDGSIRTLNEIIQVMGIYQVGQPIPPYDVDLLIEFLKSLTGNLPLEDRKREPERKN